MVWIFLFQNLFDCTALHDTVQIERSVCHSHGIILVAQRMRFIQVCYTNGWRFALTPWQLTFS